MSKEPDNQITQWLKKLEQESWQLELLVSAFTIFLLMGAISSYDGFLKSIYYEYDLSDNLLSLVYIFMTLINLSITVLTIFLVIHLLLRGFWIGTIGLRSVQSTIEFDKLNYSNYFTDKIKKKLITLDNLVILLDEICSLIFSFAFLLMSIILAFGLYILFLGAVGFMLGSLINIFPASFSAALGIVGLFVALSIMLTGLMYFIDYITLGFFKKFQWLSKIYYPIYRFYGFITLAVISRSIYYYLISRFSKKRIRVAYLLIGVLLLANSVIEYDQYQFYPGQSNEFVLSANQYGNLRSEDKYIENASIQNNVINDSFIELFLRYDPLDNDKIQSNCPEFTPLKDEGFNWRLTVETANSNFFIRGRDFEAEDKEKLMSCISSLYSISINDSSYNEQSFYYYNHPGKDQKGLLTMLGIEGLKAGENVLQIKKVSTSEEGELAEEDYATIPFWLQ